MLEDAERAILNALQLNTDGKVAQELTVARFALQSHMALLTENSRADALTDERIASAWFATSDARNLMPHERAIEVVRRFLAASPVEQPTAAPIDLIQSDYLRSLLDGSAAPAPADERAAFEAACQKLADLPESAHEKPYDDDDLDALWAFWKEARAASASERGGGRGDRRSD